MFTKISIDYPEFDLKIERDFVPGINLIEEANGYGKTTIINTIVSLYSGKYPGLRTLPNGTAKLHTDKDAYLLAKGTWVGFDGEQNDLVKYVLPGEFFTMPTTQQRLTLVKLLSIDQKAFMEERVPGWTPDMKKTVTARLKENQGKESVIIDDITRLKSRVLAFEKDPVTDDDNSQEIMRAYSLLVRNHNDNRIAIQEANFAEEQMQRNQRATIDSLAKQQEELRGKFAVAKEGKCSACGGPIDPTDAIAKINESGKALAANIKELQSKLRDPVIKPVPAPLPDISLVEQAKAVGVELRITTPEIRERIASYSADKKELALKENMLRSIGELDDKKLLDSIDKSSKEFTSLLEEKVKSIGLDIELFKEQKNGEIVESFLIMKDGKEYSELSGGNRLVVQIRLSLAFAKALGLDFILVDEAGLISQNNFDTLKNECEGFQVIMARATPFKLKPPKKD